MICRIFNLLFESFYERGVYTFVMGKQDKRNMTSEPKNHHYVSQCLLRNFFNKNEKKIYIYDKKFDNYFYRAGTKKNFSDYNLNTTLEENQLSYKLEHDLDKYFEKDFKKHYDNVVSTVKYGEGDIKKSIEYLARLGLIGELRNREYKKQMDNDILGIFKTLSEYAISELKQNIENTLNQLDKLNYKTSVDFIKFANEVFANMGEWEFNIFYVDMDKFFLLPDCTSIINRYRINEYFNPEALDIAEISMPIDNHTYIHVVSKKVRNTNNFKVVKLNDKGLLNINKYAFERAKQQIACGQMDFLKETVKKVASL